MIKDRSATSTKHTRPTLPKRLVRLVCPWWYVPSKHHNFAAPLEAPRDFEPIGDALRAETPVGCLWLSTQLRAEQNTESRAPRTSQALVREPDCALVGNARSTREWTYKDDHRCTRTRETL